MKNNKLCMPQGQLQFVGYDISQDVAGKLHSGNQLNSHFSFAGSRQLPATTRFRLFLASFSHSACRVSFFRAPYAQSQIRL
jgi:hypothetical protein